MSAETTALTASFTYFDEVTFHFCAFCVLKTVVFLSCKSKRKKNTDNNNRAKHSTDFTYQFLALATFLRPTYNNKDCHSVMVKFQMALSLVPQYNLQVHWNWASLVGIETWQMTDCCQARGVWKYTCSAPDTGSPDIAVHLCTGKNSQGCFQSSTLLLGSRVFLSRVGQNSSACRNAKLKGLRRPMERQTAWAIIENYLPFPSFTMFSLLTADFLSSFSFFFPIVRVRKT